jgi:cell division septation protein DedD
MANSEKSYLEIKVTFIHILVLLIAVILIGIFLFYLGHQAGKSAIKDQFATQEVQKKSGKSEEINIVEEQKPSETPKSREKSAIESEIKMHEKPKQEKVPIKPAQKESYYSIQVGAFADFSNARKESDKFSRLGYQTEILSTIKKNRKLFRVRIGKFKTKLEAQREKAKLEKKWKKTYTLTKSG